MISDILSSSRFELTTKDLVTPTQESSAQRSKCKGKIGELSESLLFT